MSKNKEWLTQMIVLPDQGDGEYEHDYPYKVEYNTDGNRRTVKLSQEEEDEVRVLNNLPAEEVQSKEVNDE